MIRFSSLKDIVISIAHSVGRFISAVNSQQIHSDAFAQYKSHTPSHSVGRVMLLLIVSKDMRKAISVLSVGRGTGSAHHKHEGIHKGEKP